MADQPATNSNDILFLIKTPCLAPQKAKYKVIEGFTAQGLFGTTRGLLGTVGACWALLGCQGSFAKELLEHWRRPLRDRVSYVQWVFGALGNAPEIRWLLSMRCHTSTR